MPSVLNVDTLVAANGTDPVTLTKQEAAKCYANFEFDGTQAITKSFNTSGITDIAVGTSAIAMTASMSDANYIILGNTTHDDALYVASSAIRHDVPPTTSTLNLNGMNFNQSKYDMEMAMVAIFGDLA